MKSITYTSLLLFFAVSIFTSCTKDEIKPELEDQKSKVIKDLPGDVGNTVGSGNEFETFYFSLKTGSTLAPVFRLFTLV